MRKTAPIDASKARPKEGLADSERLAISIGFGAALLLALFFGFMMYALQHPYAPSDPDAQTPIIKPDYPRHLIDFSLVDQSGRAITRKDLDGKIVVVNFVFTSCAAVCPYVNGQMEKIQQLTAGQADVRLVSLTMDPVDDTPYVLAKYGQDYGQDTSRWSFVTGNETEMHRLVGASFLPPDTAGEFAYMPGNFAHTQRIALVDTQGHLVEYFDGLNQEAGDAVAEAIAKLRKTSQ
jgi:cytochrome oxidase Cu insertion factor (SCO1/SenC/PrrC family)